MKLDSLGAYRKSTFRISDGRQFFGELSSAHEADNTMSYVQPHRTLTVGRNALVQPGDVFYTAMGRRFLVAEHGDMITGEEGVRRLRAIEITHSVPWIRKITSDDELTGLPDKILDKNMGTLDCTITMMDTEGDALKLTQRRYRILSGSAIEVGDVLDSKYQVKEVDRFLGIYVGTIL